MKEQEIMQPTGWPDGVGYRSSHLKSTTPRGRFRAHTIYESLNSSFVEHRLKGKVHFGIHSVVRIYIVCDDIGMAAREVMNSWIESRDGILNRSVQLQLESSKTQKALEVCIYFAPFISSPGESVNAYEAEKEAESLMYNLCDKLCEAGFASCESDEATSA